MSSQDGWIDAGNGIKYALPNRRSDLGDEVYDRAVYLAHLTKTKGRDYVHKHPNKVAEGFRVYRLKQIKLRALSAEALACLREHMPPEKYKIIEKVAGKIDLNEIGLTENELEILIKRPRIKR